MPLFFPFLRIIFTIPAPPSASYLDEGLVITSILSSASAGIDCSAVATFTAFDGFPSIKTRTASLPRKLTFPSASTETDGTLFKTSVALPPLTIIS